MGIIGKYRYPVRRVDDVVEYLRRIIDVVPSDVEREGFAKALGMSPRSGGLFLLLSSMKMYGFIETNMGRIRVTDLGKRVCSTDLDVANKGKVEAVMRIPLFRDMYHSLGREVNKEDAISFLVKEAGAEESEAKKRAEKILQVYRNAVPYLVKAIGEKEKIEKREIEKETGTLKIIVETKDLTLSKTFPFNRESIDSAKKLLSFLEDQIENSR